MKENISVNVGDRVRAWKWVYDTDYSMTGIVVDVQPDILPGEYVAKIKSDNGETDYYCARNDLTHKFEIVKSAPKPETLKSTPTIRFESMDISSGFGIGGAGSDDYSMATEAERFTPQFSKHKSSGQLWQPCAKRGCDNEPVCLDCEYCDDHCHCGE